MIKAIVQIMFELIKNVVLRQVRFFICNALNAISLKCVSMNNKTRNNK